MVRTTPTVARVAPDVAAAYEPVIGLEVHVQLKTATKIFCGCSTRFGDPPNSNTCPVCLGLPGSLPVLNKRALELALRASLALNLQIQKTSRFARKNYFYPDLPKGYQISMYELPLATHGFLEIEHDGAAKKIGITRLHLEEDAAKNLHEGFPDSDRNSYIDYNRCGMPLAEIVSEPDLRSPAEAHAYLSALKQLLEFADVSDCNMEEGSLRCDANVSVRRRGEERLGTKTEVKNLNSFRYLEHALEYEIERHISVLESGGRISQETRLWNVAEGRSESMRSKEFAHDYRYFPDPDLLPVHVSTNWLTEIQRDMPGVARHAPAPVRSGIRTFRLRRGRAHRDARARGLLRGCNPGGGSVEGFRRLDPNRIAAQAERIRPARRSQSGQPGGFGRIARADRSGEYNGRFRQKSFRGHVRKRQISRGDHLR